MMLSDLNYATTHFGKLLCCHFGGFSTEIPAKIVGECGLIDFKPEARSEKVQNFLQVV